MKGAHTHTMTIYTDANINQKMAPHGIYNRSPKEFGTASRSIFKMLCKSVSHPTGDRVEGQLGAISDLSWPRCIWSWCVCVCTPL